MTDPVVIRAALSTVVHAAVRRGDVAGWLHGGDVVGIVDAVVNELLDPERLHTNNSIPQGFTIEVSLRPLVPA